MKQRIISGSILLCILLYIVLAAPFLVFYSFFAIIAALSIWEYRKLIFSNDARAQVRNKPFYKNLALVIITLTTITPFLIIGLAYFKPNANTFALFYNYSEKFMFYGTFFWVISLVIYRKTMDFAYLINPLLLGVILAFINGSFFYAVFNLRYFDPTQINLHEALLNFNQSPLIFLYVILSVVCTDSGAYFVGRKFGKHKLSRVISPNKTIEGLAGGLVSAIICAILFLTFADFSGTDTLKHRVGFIIVTAVAVAFSVHGDLFESFLKRRSGIKDSSQLIPGHGGVLDRIDSLQAAFTIFTYYWYYVLMYYITYK